MYQFRKTRQKYKSYATDAECNFCKPEKYCKPVLEVTKHCYVVYNRTFYDVWELRRVEDHRMVIPKRHVLSLDELTNEELLDLMMVTAKYEKQEYNIYARAPGNASRSVDHQHTHLIKTSSGFGRGLLVWHKPYILWLFR